MMLYHLLFWLTFYQRILYLKTYYIMLYCIVKVVYYIDICNIHEPLCLWSLRWFKSINMAQVCMKSLACSGSKRFDLARVGLANLRQNEQTKTCRSSFFHFARINLRLNRGQDCDWQSALGTLVKSEKVRQFVL